MLPLSEIAAWLIKTSFDMHQAGTRRTGMTLSGTPGYMGLRT